MDYMFDTNRERKLLAVGVAPLLGGVILRRTPVSAVLYLIINVFLIFAFLYAVFVALTITTWSSAWLLVLRIRLPDTTMIACILIFHIILTIVALKKKLGSGAEKSAILIISNIIVLAYAFNGIIGNSTTHILSMAESHLFMHNDYSVYSKTIQVSVTPVFDGSHPEDKDHHPILYMFPSPPKLLPGAVNYSLLNPTERWVDDYAVWDDYSFLSMPVFWSAFNLNAGSSITVSYSADWDTTVSMYLMYVRRHYGVVYWDFNKEVKHAAVFGVGTESATVKDTGLYILSFSPDSFDSIYPLVTGTFQISSTQYNISGSDNVCQFSDGARCPVTTSKPFVITTPVLHPDSRTYWKVVISHEPIRIVFIILIVLTFISSRFITSVIDSADSLQLSDVPYGMFFGHVPERAPLLQPGSLPSSPTGAVPHPPSGVYRSPSFGSREASPTADQA